MQYFDISNLNFNQIKIFICVAESGSFSDAARKLNYSQSMVSKTISSLEHDLGIQLVLRVKSQNILTEAGSSLYKDFKRLLKDMEDSVARAFEVQLNTDTTLRIGVIDCVTSRETLACAIAEKHLIYRGLETGLNYTILQPVHYHHNIFVNELLEKGEFYNYNGLDVPLAFVDAEDVAEVCAKVLTEGDKHNMAAYQLCGPSYLNPVECANLFNEISGLNVVAKYIEPDELENFWPGYMGNDSYSIEAFKALQYTYTKWGFPGNKNVLEYLLGRPATDLAQYFRKELTRLGGPIVK